MEENLFSESINPKFVFFSRKWSVWVLPWNSARFKNSNSNFCRGSLPIPLIAKLNCLELSEFVILSIMKLVLDQTDFFVLNESENAPC